MSWVDKNQWTNAFAPASGRRVGRIQSGSQGNHVSPTSYFGRFGQFPLTTPTLSNGAKQPDVDVPNLSFFTPFTTSSVVFPAARNKAWSDLVENVRSGPASLGVTLAEWNESFEMIASRFSQCYRGYRSLRKGDFRGFLRTFGIGAKRKHKNLVRSGANQASSLWLEYSFGWKPLFQDVYDAAHATSQPVPGGPCKGRGIEPYTLSSRSECFDTIGRCRMGAKVFVSNPNQYLLQQLGIANPLLIVWELVPFSFVADWVFDIGTFLGAFTDLLGCEVRDSYTTYSSKAFVKALWDPTHVLNGRCAAVRRHEGLDFPMPNFHYQANIGRSLTRAANAASLLGQILTK